MNNNNYDAHNYVQHKVHNCKHYDRKRGFYDEIRTVTKEWILEQVMEQFNRCHYCKTQMTYGDGPTNKTDITVERIDNSHPHNKRNCILACLNCNTWRSDNCSSEEWVVMMEALHNTRNSMS
jgi:hypothetical protein